MNVKNIGYYVIEDNTDALGYGDYLFQFSAQTFDEADQWLRSNPKCTHIDYFDGERWHYEVKAAVSP